MCNGVVYVDDVTLLFKGSASFLSEPGLRIAVCTSPVSAAQKRFISNFGSMAPDTFSVPHFTPPSVCFTFPFSAPSHFLMPSMTLMSVWSLSTHPPTPLSLQIPFSQFLSPLLSPHLTSLTPSCHWGSQRPLFVLPPTLPSGSPFPCFSLRFSLPCFVSLAVPSDFSLCPSVHLSLHVSVFLFSYISPSPSVCLSGVCHRHAHFTSKQFYPVPLNWSYSISLCYFPGRNIYPDAV